MAGYDGHGNARFLANASGAITDTYTYTFDAFGAPIASTGTTPNAFLPVSYEFVGCILDYLPEAEVE
jgi:hypothetical protein